MNFLIEKVDNVIIAKLNGRIDIIISEDIEKEFNALITSGEKNIIFDLNDVSYFSSSGVRMLITAKNKLDEINGILCLTKVTTSAIKIMSTLGLLKRFRIFDTIKLAIEYIKEQENR
jgi:anti-anti-sigma factor